MPRAALKDLANARGLASAATEARAEFGRSSGAKSDDIDEDGVELWADWRCSCVRLRGAPAAVRCAVSLGITCPLQPDKCIEQGPCRCGAQYSSR